MCIRDSFGHSEEMDLNVTDGSMAGHGGGAVSYTHLDVYKRQDYYEDDIEIPQTVIDAAPADMTLVYWDYYHDDEAGEKKISLR